MLFAVTHIHEESSRLSNEAKIILQRMRMDLVKIEQNLLGEKVDIKLILDALNAITKFLKQILEYNLSKHQIFETDFVTHLQEAKDKLFIVKCNPNLSKLSIAKKLNEVHNALLGAIFALDKMLDKA